MGNIIIVAILAVLIVFGIYSSIKHFQGHNGCCSGGREIRPRHKRLEHHVTGRYILTIDGMHCENCRNRVEQTLNDIEGISAKVSLHRKTAIAAADREISEQMLQDAVAQAGYTIQSMEYQRKK